MKKFLLSAGVFLLAAGLALSTLGLRMGGRATASVHLFGRTWDVSAPFAGGAMVVGSARSVTAAIEEHAPSATLMPGNAVADVTSSEPEDLEPFSFISVDVDLGDVTIAAGDDYAVSIDYWGPGYRVDFKNRDGMLVVQSSGGSGHIVGSSYGSNIVIYVPSGTSLDTVQANLDLGSLTMAGLTVHEVEAELDLGSFVGEGLTVTGHFDVDADLGDVTIYGQLGESVVIDADLGSVTLGLSNPASDYYWSLSADLGSVTVDGSTLGSNKTVTGGHGGNWLKVDADLGSITVDFGVSNPTPTPPLEAQVEEGTKVINGITYTFYDEAETAVAEQSAS